MLGARASGRLDPVVASYWFSRTGKIMQLWQLTVCHCLRIDPVSHGTLLLRCTTADQFSQYQPVQCTSLVALTLLTLSALVHAIWHTLPVGVAPPTIASILLNLCRPAVHCTLSVAVFTGAPSSNWSSSQQMTPTSKNQMTRLATTGNGARCKQCARRLHLRRG